MNTVVCGISDADRILGATHIKFFDVGVQIVGPESHIFVHKCIVVGKISVFGLQRLFHLEYGDVTVWVTGAVNGVDTKPVRKPWRLLGGLHRSGQRGRRQKS